tara:strand:- start:1253 stop:1852 length:600 start_codon:yes stop_codon:yes gene_type:complete
MLSIVCKHVSTGSKIYSTIEQRTACVLTTNDFCKFLNSKMSTLLGKDNTFNHFDIIYVDDGENNIDKKFPEDSAIPFISRLPNSSLTYDLTLAFYARDKIPSIPTIPSRSISSTASNNSAAICAYSCENLPSLNTFENPETTCCVCYTETTISCNDYFNCGNDKHFICNTCYEKTRSHCTSHRCPVCRAPPYAEFLSIN